MPLESNCYVLFAQRWSLIKGFTLNIHLHQALTFSIFQFPFPLFPIALIVMQPTLILVIKKATGQSNTLTSFLIAQIVMGLYK